MPKLRLINPRNPLNHLVDNDVARRMKRATVHRPRSSDIVIMDAGIGELQEGDLP
jgi:hypothetical protein